MPTRSRPLLVFDGDCHFCRRWIARWRRITGESVDYAAYQQVAPQLPEIPVEKFQRSVVLVEADGGVFSGAEAVFRSLSYGPGRGKLLWAYRNVPGVAPLSEAFYRFVAAHRPGFSRLTGWLWGRSVEPSSHQLTRWLFVRLLASIYFIAFVSLGVQWKGLIGEGGILPARPFLEAVAASLGADRFVRLPTLCWLSPGDSFIHFLWMAGAVVSVLVFLDLAPGPGLLLLWVIYLSLLPVFRDFLHFQWDILLLETGFLSAFFAPWKLRPGLSRESPASPALLWMLRWLLFRLMFASGVVKLASGDPTWWNLTALEAHYETQPLPTWIGWYAHQFPPAVQRGATAGMFLIELALPFLIFLPRRPRLLAFAGFVSFQILIGLTGNYCFFNLLTIALSFLLLDDFTLARFFPARWHEPSPSANPPGKRSIRGILVAGLVVLLLPLTVMNLSRCFRRPIPWPESLLRYEAELAPLRLSSGYGLFARMTPTRPEIVIEGSNDGVTWLPYEFRWKPGDLRRRPGFVEPHQPRLDWQMWFAALSDFRSTPWFQQFLARLLEGSPDVLALLASNPFPEAPPKQIRAVLYEYHFTDFATRRKDGTWWRREEKGLYCPPVSLRAK